MNCFRKFKKRDKANTSESSLEPGINQRDSIVSTKKQQNLRVFSPAELQKATRNFSNSVQLGEGSYSTVFKGAIELHGTGNPTIVAIKRFKQDHALRGALAVMERPEVILLGGFDHPNVVKLLGYCSADGRKGNHKYLVYEYMEHGSLERHLFGNNLPALSWNTRLQIMLGAAQGLAHLHEGLPVPIIHRDFKTPAVLLDKYFRAKLSGFTLARQVPDWVESDVSTQVVGTYGYADPVYISTGHVSMKSDIYSFGVVLYEILTGRRVIDSTEQFHLLEWVKRHPAKRKRFHRILDPRLQGNYSRSDAVSIAKLADRCISGNPEDRPTIRQIINLLNDMVGTVHFSPIESCSDANVGDNYSAFIEMALDSDVPASDLDVGHMDLSESLSDQSECQPPDKSECQPPDKDIQLSAPTPTEIGPVWKEYQHKPHAVPATEHRHPTLPMGTDDNKSRLVQRMLDPDEELEAKRLLFLFGEGYEFEKQMLIQLWMALGLLSDEPMEVTGAYYFENLVSEGYVLCSVDNSLYKVNFEKLGTELNINNRNYVKLDNTRNNNSSTEILHASVVCDEVNASIFQTLGGFKRLRTLLFLGNYGSRLQQVPRNLFLCYESLEALDLSGTHIKELPSSAGKMINLRYLDLSWTFLEALPERIDRFRKLQTLKLEGCSHLRRLPNEMKGLTDLRHLHLDVLRELAAFPEGIGALVNIRTLSAFPVGAQQGLKISELKYLNHITGSFCIAKIENVQSADEAKEAFLNTKKNIKSLKLRWSNHKAQHSMNEDECILQNLCPCSDLEEIQIVCYSGSKLPDWIADVSFDKLVSITLFGCVILAILPSLEKLPSLESLELIGLDSITKMDFKGIEADYIAFRKLQKLSLDGMLNLEMWEEAREGDYPCLVELSIRDCPKLLRFPSIVCVPTLKHLEVSSCTDLALVSDEMLSISLEQLIVENCPSIEDRCCKDGGQDWHKIQHVPTIWFNQVAIQSIEDSKKASADRLEAQSKDFEKAYRVYESMANDESEKELLEEMRRDPQRAPYLERMVGKREMLE